MARPTKEEAELKLKALRTAFEVKKKETTFKSFEAEKQDIVDEANNSEIAKHFKTEINVQSLKQPTTEGLKELKKDIEKFKKDFTDSKANAKNTTKKIIEDQEETIKKLTIQVSKCLDELDDQNRKLIREKASKEKIRLQRDEYRRELEAIKNEYKI